MKIFRVLEVTVTAGGYDVKAETEEEAVKKIEASFGGTTADIERMPEYDNTISREYQCEGEV